MGNHQSRSLGDDDQGFVTIRRQIGKRSSVNILKRIDSKQPALARPPSTLARYTLPDIVSPSSPPSHRDHNVQAQPSPSVSQPSETATDHDHPGEPLPRTVTSSTIVPSKKTEASDDSFNETQLNTASECASTRITSLESSNVDDTRCETPTRSSNSIGTDDNELAAPVTAHRRRTTDIELLRETESTSTRSDAPQRIKSSSVPNLVLAEMPTHLISLLSNSPVKPYRPTSKLAPPEFFHGAARAQHFHSTKTTTSNDARVLRLVRQRYPQNLVRESDPFAPNDMVVKIALAMPLTRAQSDCHGQHRKWVASNNAIASVECAICLAPRETSESTLTANAWVCVHCAVRVCTTCKTAVEQQGKDALMKRYDDGRGTNTVDDENES